MSKETITKALSVILAFLLCVAVFAIFAKFTSNFSEGFKTFYVTYDGKDIVAQESQMYLAPGEEHVFNVTYTFEFLDEGEKVNTDYDVKIVSNIEKNKLFVIIMSLISVIQCLMIYYGGTLFRCVPLKFHELSFVILISLTLIPFEMMRRLVFKLK